MALLGRRLVLRLGPRHLTSTPRVGHVPSIEIGILAKEKIHAPLESLFWGGDTQEDKKLVAKWAQPKKAVFGVSL